MPRRTSAVPTAVTVRRGSSAAPAAPTSGRRRTPLAALAARLTPRDLWLLDMLAEHTALTSHHITELAYTGHRTANRRLATLHRLGLLDSFRLRLPVGSAPETYVLGQVGAQILAARHATTPAALGWHPELATRTAYNPELLHNLGVAQFFARLAANPPEHSRLAQWWSEARCARIWGDLARPDAKGELVHGARRVAFFLEYDTGTEPLTRVVAKLDDYAELALTTGIRPLVAFTLHSHRREAHLRERLTGHHALASIAVATTARDLPADGSPDYRPGEAVWLPVGVPTRRARLIDLPTVWPTALQPTTLTSPVPDPSPLPAPNPLPPTDAWTAGLLRQS
ncbi:replication-relaxation family protein [Streptacidiphilus sp. MAP5-3]|uniref:replication-relaxation family protein n=1 Tax=unclassified Streptacidiphilus TaxID=2643834 RepID=UPI003511FBD3